MELLPGLALRLFDFIVSKLTSEPRIQVQIKGVTYDYFSDVISAWTSRYLVESNFTNTGDTLTTITGVSPDIDGVLKLSPSDFEPFELKPGGFQIVQFTFPVEKKRAIIEGGFKLVARDTFGKEVKASGRFPI